MSIESLFSSHKIADLCVKNRFVCSATHLGTSYPGGFPTEHQFKFYGKLAENDVGLIITENTLVDGYGSCDRNKIFSNCMMDDDSYMESWKKIVDEVHKYGSKIFIQLSHPGIQESIRFRHPLAPSPVQLRPDGVIPDELTLEQIKSLIEKFVDACIRSKKIGFDGVQLHSAHGYLISNFISPFTNKRRDKYGGNNRNRARFLTDILEKVKPLTGNDFPIITKLNCCDVEGGLDIDQFVEIAGHYIRKGIDAIEVSGGTTANITCISSKNIKSEEDEAYFLKYSKLLKENFAIPLILVGGLRSPNIMSKIIANNQADFISMSRPFISEPALISRWKSGDHGKAKCISCNLCLDELMKGKDVHCVVNEQILKSKKSRNIP
ncbi:MAG: NADH:flavin oxidoreductase [Desulfobacteraceae bacterium]|nr:NADH:flavin oxidoreductase [Desulfobacteraceae bacterium]